MKAVTHDVFSLGLGLFLVYHVERSPGAFFLVLIFWLAFATNSIIDVLGHAERSGRPVRSIWTHSVLTAPIWGAASALASAYLIDIIFSQTMTAPQTFFAAGLGIMFAYSHLLLDALTEGGVYLARRRVALAHLRYDNPILNGAFAALGVLLVFGAIV